MHSAELVAGLLRSEAYPWRPPTVELVETHVSWVFLAGDRVVKVKRPVAYGFVDHTTLARRRRSCLDEVRLNRRLTDGVYLAAVPVGLDADGRPRLGSGGEVVEWATLMRRLPAAGMLDAVLATGDAPPDLAERLAARLIPFHQRRAAPCDGSPAAAAEAATRVIADNLDELEPFAGAPLGAVQLALVAEAMRRFMGEHAGRFRDRAAAGWVREGHGDLRAEHVCLEPDGAVQVFDCVEFSRALRCADVASDLAFLLLDLDRLGARAVASALLTRYREAGVDLPDDLLRFYRAHRALVRAKVACLRSGSAGPGLEPGLATEAADHLDLAAASALTVRPALIAMTGLSGTGKSTVAAALGRALDATVVASDVVRKELAGHHGPAPAGWRTGLYAPDRTEATYARLLELAAPALAAGAAVVLDATFLDRRHRDAAARLAARVGVPFVLVETVCDEAVVARRLDTRQAGGRSASDATLEIHRRQRAALGTSPPHVPPGARHVRVDTSAEGPVDLDPVLTMLRRDGIVAARIPAERSALVGSGGS